MRVVVDTGLDADPQETKSKVARAETTNISRLTLQRKVFLGRKRLTCHRCGPDLGVYIEYVDL